MSASPDIHDEAATARGEPSAPREERGAALGERRRRRNWLVVVGWCGFIAACLIFPGSPADGIIFCPFRLVTGLSCPGCGMTRACTAAVRGDLWASLQFHPLGLLLIAGFGLEASRRLIENVRGVATPWPGASSARLVRLRGLVYLGALLFVLLFGGARLVLEIVGILTPVW